MPKLPLPRKLQSHIDMCEDTVSQWPVVVTMDHVSKWFLNFDCDDFDLPLRTISNLSVLGTPEIQQGLNSAYGRVCRLAASSGRGKRGKISTTNTVYATMGSAAKSGGLTAYHLRVAELLPESNFTSNSAPSEDYDLSSIDNFILIDDFLGTGKTAIEEIKRFYEEFLPLGLDSKLYAMFIAGYRESRDRIAKETGVEAVCGYEFELRRDTAASLDATFYDGLDTSERESLLARLKRYNRTISTGELGHGQVGGLLAFEYNTPNTTLPIVWATGNNWRPLFIRAQKVPGLARMMKPISERRKRHEVTVVTDRSQRDLTLLVEGKLDELFFDFLNETYNLSEKLSVASVKPIAIGSPHVLSTRLLEHFLRGTRLVVLVVEKETKDQKSLSGHSPGIPTCLLAPNFLSVVRVDALFEPNGPLDKSILGQEKQRDDLWYEDVYTELFHRRNSRQRDQVFKLLAEYIDESSLEEFISQLRRAVDESWARQEVRMP